MTNQSGKNGGARKSVNGARSGGNGHGPRRPRVILMTSKCDYLAHDVVAPPMGLHRLRHYLNTYGYSCDVFDHQLQKEQDLLDRVEQGNYDIIGASVTHWQITHDANFHWQLRNAAARGGHQCVFIAGGNPATQDSDTWLDIGFDAILLGFAEDNLLGLCKRYEERPGKSLDEIVGDLDGVTYADSSGTIVRRPSPFMTLDDFVKLSYRQELTMPNVYTPYWAHVSSLGSEMLLINGRSYVFENARLYTSSHCAALCGFCDAPTFISASQGQKAGVHALTPSQVRELIVHHCEQFGARAFSFNDDNFLLGNVVGVRRVLNICLEIVEAKRLGEIPQDTVFSCQARGWDYLIHHPDGSKTPNYELMKAMQEAGFHNLSLGTETLSNRLMASPSINKGSVRRKHYEAVISAMRDLGLFVTMNLILGIPETTPDELLETIEAALEYCSGPFQLSIAYKMFAFPGAPIWGRPDYPTSFREWVHPATGKRMEIPYHFIPHHPKIAAIMETLEDESHAQIRRWKAQQGWDAKVLTPRVVHALSAFSLITQALDAPALEARIRERWDEMLVEVKAGLRVPTAISSIC